MFFSPVIFRFPSSSTWLQSHLWLLFFLQSPKVPHRVPSRPESHAVSSHRISGPISGTILWTIRGIRGIRGIRQLLLEVVHNDLFHGILVRFWRVESQVITSHVAEWLNVWLGRLGRLGCLPLSSHPQVLGLMPRVWQRRPDTSRHIQTLLETVSWKVENPIT